MRAGEDLVILDMGSGLRPLGESFGGAPVHASIFLSHYHWDHLQGLPFFGPAYHPASTLEIRGPTREGKDVRAIVAGQMVAPYFPVGIEALRAQLTFGAIASGQTVMVGRTKVSARELNHPNGALAYRIERDGKAVVYATDTEHGTPADEALSQLARDADALIYDAMYTEEEYRAGKVGWGHSTWQAGVRVVERAGARRLVLFHHEPSRTDAQLAEILARAQSHAPRTVLAREGDVLEL